MTTNYKRPTGSTATAVGERNRARWSRHLRERLGELVRPVDFSSAKEACNTDAVAHLRSTGDKSAWYERPAWVTARIRADQMATLNLLQKRHLKATGKEISKAEVLAALMAAGLETIINHKDFGGTIA